jgi:D-alanine-D-alanine ligase
VTSAEHPPHVDPSSLSLRDAVRPGDLMFVRDIVASTGFFTAAEVEVAVELVQEHLARGTRSGYFFLFAELAGQTVGYTCYGPIACTAGSYDLYWIVVEQALRHRGLGRFLLEAAEARITQAGGRRVYIETSGRALYQPTQAFYERCGYAPEAVLRDFYAPGDPKIVYSKAIAPTT